MSSDQNIHQTICPTNTSHKNSPPILKYELDQPIHKSKQLTVYDISILGLSQ